MTTTPCAPPPTTNPRVDQRDPGTRPDPQAVVDIVVPVYNEQASLEVSVRRLHVFLSSALPVSARITIADNASTDGTWPLACRLACDLPGVRAIRLERKGRGRALRNAWTDSDADILVYMDVDLSTDLAALLPLIAPLLSGHSDLAIGTRLAHGSRVVRGRKREFISRTYNRIVRASLGARFSDAQCGFKAIRRDRAQQLLPLVRDEEWFFDTELLVLAERAGLRIHEVPVDWIDDPVSKVDITSTAVADLKGIARLRRSLARDQVALRVEPEPGPPRTSAQIVRFAAIGVASTIAYVVLYLMLRVGLGPVLANALALLTTAIANTAVNRRLTFGVRGRANAVRHQAQGLAVFGLALAVTTAALGVLHAASANPGRSTEASVLVIANLAATAIRFGLLRGWVFAGSQAAHRG
ncbi:MAG TPA: bifunctional glycosyltransferase family 2/GtrA family protein [Mycobacteriales bacterium]|nr:bifunctional glycosyltransferase family 2/GtrA family protein [Mycobacteriales bacterium]